MDRAVAVFVLGFALWVAGGFALNVATGGLKNGPDGFDEGQTLFLGSLLSLFFLFIAALLVWFSFGKRWHRNEVRPS